MVFVDSVPCFGKTGGKGTSHRGKTEDKWTDHHLSKGSGEDRQRGRTRQQLPLPRVPAREVDARFVTSEGPHFLDNKRRRTNSYAWRRPCKRTLQDRNIAPPREENENLGQPDPQGMAHFGVPWRHAPHGPVGRGLDLPLVRLGAGGAVGGARRVKGLRRELGRSNLEKEEEQKRRESFSSPGPGRQPHRSEKAMSSSSNNVLTAEMRDGGRPWMTRKVGAELQSLPPLAPWWRSSGRSSCAKSKSAR